MKISVIITLKKDVLDPQGKVIHQTLDGMGFNDVNEVRQGKYFEIDTKEAEKVISNFNKPNIDKAQASKTKSSSQDKIKTKKISKK